MADTNNFRIQKFSQDGNFITSWGSQGSENGQFLWPKGIAIDDSGNVYVTDSAFNCVQEFSPDGAFIVSWGNKGSENGSFNCPVGIGVDSKGDIYVADAANHRVQKFSSNGNFIVSWGTPGSGNGEFNWPEGIALDENDNVYVSDVRNNRIQKFTSNGQFHTEFGEPGFYHGGLSGPMYLCVGKTGKVYIADTHNNRIQVVGDGAPKLTQKAIIVAGGGPFPGNNLWNAARMCANYAYRALSYQGFTRDNIYYLSSDIDLNVEGNGILDDVDADAINSNLEYAITSWAQDAQDIFIYMVDHGGAGTFRMSASELLEATHIDAWLDTIQEVIPGMVAIVDDSCRSGIFLPLLLQSAGKKRILVTSASADQEAIFIDQGTVSFSFFFWARMFNGDSFYDSFVHAKNSVGITYNAQTAQVEGNGNGIGNEKADKDAACVVRIGNERRFGGDIPFISSISPTQTLNGGTSAMIYAQDVIDADCISRVWAVITPPGYSTGSSVNPVTDLPIIGLNLAGDNRYEAIYDTFTDAGTYNIAIFAIDERGILSLPKQTSVIQTKSIGDINGDGNVDLADAIITLKMLAGMDTSDLIRSDYTA